MATAAFEDIVSDFQLFDDWEQRYRHVIDLGKSMPALEVALCVPANKVEGCASQVWLHPEHEGDTLHFRGESDAMIVRGLIAVLRALYDGTPLSQAREIDARAELSRLGLDSHLSAQRSNGLAAMITRIRSWG